MLIKLRVSNFKRFSDVEVELGNPVVFIGPNNSGKTTALEALAFWEVGLRRWTEKRSGRITPEKRPGVTINRRDLVSIPAPTARLLWRDLHVRDIQLVNGKQETRNVRIDVVVDGIAESKAWQCGLEFDYANEESFYCRPMRLSEDKSPERMPIPKEAEGVKVAFLPPMSGLSANESRLDAGAINVRVGEGRTAEVLRNLCYVVYTSNPGAWEEIVHCAYEMFGVTLKPPEYIPERGEIVMAYEERNTKLDISSSGRGLQQLLLLLAYMYGNPGTVLLLDEPDAHLEILRQRQVYQLLTTVARSNNNQIIAASHSEVLLNEAADRDVVVAFVGTPHRIDDRGSQVSKSLKTIGFEQYYQAEQVGWVLYLEGSTDLAILRALAETLDHKPAVRALERPFVYYVGDQPNKANDHFYGIREAVPNLKGVAIFDRLEKGLPENLGPEGMMWRRREIENYLTYRETLTAYARATAADDVGPGPLFAKSEADYREKAMEESIDEISEALVTLGKDSPWSDDLKVSDEFLTPLFELYYQKLRLPNIMAKKNFCELARYVPREKIDEEVVEKLNAIVTSRDSALPVE